ncbi:MAG TPA: sigma-70 family RNA polymerase sigma factor [Acidimicrobiia bacterium]|nr:sigma-70 family RNA polymerase sigma factor [Acidimicrobiia bacterium]
MTDWEAERRFERVYEAYHRQVYAYFRRRTDLLGAQDCAAQTFLLVWRRLDRVPEGDAALPWLYAAARRVLANHNRASRRFSRLVGRLAGLTAPDPARPEAIVLRREAEQEVLDALDLLRPDDRELLRLAFWEEVPRDQLAGMCRCTPHALSQRIQRAEARLARHLPAAGHTHAEAAPRQTQEGPAT